MSNTNSTDEIDKLIKPLTDNGWHENNKSRSDCSHCKKVDEAKRQIQALLTEAYKKGFIDGGVGEIVRAEKARQAVEAELTNTGEVSNE